MLRSFFVFLYIILISTSCADNNANEVLDACLKSDLSLSLTTVKEATSCTTPDGEIIIAVTGGEQPYTLLLNGEVQPGYKFSNLYAGVYTIIVRDNKACEVVAENVTLSANDLTLNTRVIPNSSCTLGNGEVTIEVPVEGGPYLFKLADGSFTENNHFAALKSGQFTIEVKSAANCIIPLTIYVPQLPTGVSWANDIKPLIQTSCALSGCHNGDARPDLRQYDKAKFYATTIKSKTQDRTMPFDGTLTQAEIDLIACWVDEGALNN